MKIQVLTTILLTTITLSISNPHHNNIRHLQNVPANRTSTAIKPIILQPIPSIHINVRYAKPSPIAGIIKQFRGILSKPTTNQQQNNKDVPFYCSQLNTTNMRFPHNQTMRQKLVATKYGFNMYVDSYDSTVSYVIDHTGTWEPEYIHLIGKIVRKGNNVLNLGSQSGLQALVMGKIIGPTGKLFIFQPYNFSNQLVNSNIELNNLTNITTVYKVAASDEIRNSSILVQYSNTGGSNILQRVVLDKQKYGADQIQIIETNLVDNLLPQYVSLDFALIDVEKMEVKALRGMRNIIERSPNLVMMVEWQYGLNIFSNKQQTIELIEWLFSKGYRIYTYMGGNYKKCKLGWFTEEKKLERILKTNFADFLFFPSTVRLPS